MFNEKHDLAKEFPEYKQAIHDLKGSDAHFAKRAQEYDDVNDELHRIEQEIETPGDEYVEGLKRKRLALRDELYHILKQKAA